MKRRESITVIAGAASWRLALRAQQGGERRIGVSMGMVENDPEACLRVAAFRQGSREIGWTEGRNIHIEFRWPLTSRNSRALTPPNWPALRRKLSWRTQY